MKRKFVSYSVSVLGLCAGILVITNNDNNLTLPITKNTSQNTLIQKRDHISNDLLSNTKSSTAIITKKTVSSENNYLVNLAIVSTDSDDPLINSIIKSLPEEDQLIINSISLKFQAYRNEINMQGELLASNPPNSLSDISQIILGSFDLMSKHMSADLIEQKYGHEKQLSHYLIERTRILNNDDYSYSLKQQYINELGSSITDTPEQRQAQIDNMKMVLESIPVSFENSNEIKALELQLENLSDEKSLIVDLPGNNWTHELQTYNFEKQKILNISHSQDEQDRLINELRQITFTKTTDSTRIRKIDLAQNVFNNLKNYQR